ncbi:aldo/keto reductase [cf. Phormidesmis sp. LEGE 11477]|uniref:aldo/keto reductase n=1 Tax=cf. Phormidesmis sp. LEGE 11477 TaxID=1828680 RepID=UPI001882397D|nr:aldo/keto reductase [cf. Phormidesmis sp. LEGE 11477]MBE9063627.1 aldo/keto reductase [cf. Phormidesmis sp. LEGE 11477]
MLYRRFGRTELQMPVFSCGGMRYQHSWQDVAPEDIPQKNQENLEATIRRAVALGINHIETARGYGTSEIQLGKVLPTFERSELIVQSKVSPRANPNEFSQTVELSLANLNLDYLDLLGFHGINNAETLDYSIRPGGCMDAAKKLQAQGKVRHIGFSTHGPTQVIVDAIASNLFDYVNIHWYYIFQDNWRAIEAAAERDMGVFIISPSNKGGNLYSPPPKLVELCKPLSPMVFNDLFCLSHPQVHTLSLGAACPSDFDEHMKVLPLVEKADEVLPPILERLEQQAIATLGERWYRTWQEGLPDLQSTPGNINIAIALWLGNLVEAFDMIEYAQSRYNLLGGASHWFPGNKADHLSRFDLTESLKNSPHAKTIPKRLAKIHEKIGGADVKRLSQQ